ncbi:MAG: molecular chaperone HtpG [Micavibrio sp.]
MTQTEKLSFGADVSRLLDIVAHALYSNRDVFLRELISNASDACDRLRYESIANPDLAKDDSQFRIHIYKDTDYRFLHVVDNGIGMTRDELVDNLGTIAKSGTRALMEHLGKGGKDKLSLIGQFGVGFYASFMVAGKVEVVSRRAGTTETWHWESDGRTGFEVREATPEEAAKLIGDRGTAIILNINDDSSEYLIDDKLKQVILTYSDHINVPVFLETPAKHKADDEPLNKASALWMRPKSEVTAEQYSDFYHALSFGIDEPFVTSHWRAEGKIEFSALLFVPTLRPWDLFDPSRKNAVRLYVKRVFITDNSSELMFPWLRFVKGVIDSEDLPLNISREMLQHNPVISRIRSSVATRILTDLEKLMREDPVGYTAFWGQFGAVLKEGLYDAVDHREFLFRICQFNSTHNDGALTTLADYIARMKPEQENIFFISGENVEALKNSPQLEGFRARGLEVLLLTDTVDDFWLQQVQDYKDKFFKSITKGSIDLSKFPDPTEGTKDKDKKTDPGVETLIATLKDLLKDEIGDVRLSARLTDSPVCLVAGDNDVDMNMERVLKLHQKYEAKSKRVLEINGHHPLITRLAHENKDSADFSDAAYLLLDQARIIQGEPVPDPSGFARRMAAFMEKGLAA